MIYPSQSLFAGRGGEGLLFISRLRIPCRMRCFYYFCMRKTNNMDIASPSSHPKAAFLIGAATSNSGKTTLTIGLLRALRERGLAYSRSSVALTILTLSIMLSRRDGHRSIWIHGCLLRNMSAGCLPVMGGHPMYP